MVGIFEQYRKGKIEEQVNKEVKAEEPSLSDILADQRQSALFARYLESSAGNDEKESEQRRELAGRLLKRSLEEDDLKTLAEARIEFLKRLESAKSVKESITPQFIDELMLINEDFRNLANLVGKEKVIDVLVGEMDRLAVEGKEEFQSIITSLNKIKEARQKAEYRE
ncbi:MAG: hypothetical protein NZ822_01030 [Patescibacteria group bacterium]|nr:hypothetical protein [Patescibacteria group bacterium]